MKARTITIAVLAFAAGIAMHLLISRFVAAPADEDAEVARHWQLVNGYNAHMRDPGNIRVNAGFSGVEIPYDPEPSLAALVAAGELEHVDIVFPLVPKKRATNLHWMQFVEEHQDTILYATGNPEYVDYKPSGEQPLHLILWFKRSAQADVQQLIKELEAFAEPDRSRSPALPARASR